MKNFCSMLIFCASTILVFSIKFDVNLSPGTVIANAQEYLTLGILNDDGTLYKVSATIIVAAGANQIFPNPLTVNYLGSEITSNLQFVQIGQVSLTISTQSYTETRIYNVQALTLKFITDIQVLTATSQTALPISIEVYNSNSTQVDTQNVYAITLELNCNSKCSGTIFKVVTNSSESTGSKYAGATSFGVLTLSQFFILSSGTFSIIASTSLATSASSSVVVIQNTLQTISIFPNKTSESAYTNISVSIQLFGDDGNYYLQYTQISLTTNSSFYIGDTSNITNTGQWNLSCYFNHSGSQIFSVTTNASKATASSTKLQIAPNFLNISGMSQLIPVNTRQTFGFNVNIYDSTGTRMITDKDPINVTAFVDDTHALGGATEKGSVKGVVVFAGLNFEDVGEQVLQVSIGDGNFSYPTSFEIVSTDCLVGSGPIACACVLLFFIIVGPLVFFYSDKKVASFPKAVVFLIIYPPSALVFKAPHLRRISVCVLIVTSELLMLTLIGGVYAYFDDPTQHYEKSFSDYYGRVLYKGGMGWALAHVGIIPLFFLHFFGIYDKKLLKIFFIVCSVVVILCFGAMIGMTVKYCIGFSQYWTANFLIYFLIDLAVMHLIYTLICLIVMTKNIRNTLLTSNKTLKEESDRHSSYSLHSDNNT